jgi:hypothetical protein
MVRLLSVSMPLRKYTTNLFVVVADGFAELRWGVLVQELDQIEALSLDRDQFIKADLVFVLLARLVHQYATFR